jgi:hypothetical protein
MPTAVQPQGMPATKDVPSTNGQHFAMHNGKANGVNRLNGRLMGLMTPVGAEG